MAKIIIHAGMGKTGSSSIQAWLRDHGEWLREEAGVAALSARVDPTGDVWLGVDAARNMNSGPIARHYMAHPEHRQQLADSLYAQLDKHARSQDVVVLSSEALSRWFWRVDDIFLKGLNQLANSHTVQVAYYVRPQHTALEAAWKQWGFRQANDPSEFLAQRCRQLDYFQTLTSVGEVAPLVVFTPRPFRPDLLHAGSVVGDFGWSFLDVESKGDRTEVWENRSLPLDVVNVLHAAPAGLLWRSEAAREVNPVLARLKGLTLGLDASESGKVRLSRLVLQQVCHERFEEGNRRLIAALGWETEEWVPAVEADIGEASLERLDYLWRPDANPAELALLHQALAHLVEKERNG